MKHYFRIFSSHISRWAGSPVTFILAVTLILAWAVVGPVFEYSNTWQLVINTTTTIVTFLMVFLIQNTQNRDSLATQIKLDELIRSVQGARNTIVNIEEGEDENLERLQEEFRMLQEKSDKLQRRMESQRTRSRSQK